MTALLLILLLMAVVLMAAPTPTARTNPTGTTAAPDPDGQGTKITFSAAAGLAIWEQEVKPSSFENGDPVNMTNMFNTTWRTKLPKILKEMGEVSGVCGINAASIPLAYAQVGVNQTITLTFRGGSTLCFYGYLKTFDPQNHQEGVEKTANITIVPTNIDPVNNVEAGPVYTP